jgi:hypothetical protein
VGGVTMHKAAIILALCLLVLSLSAPSAFAQPDQSLSPISIAIGIVFGAGLLLFFISSIMELKISDTTEFFAGVIMLFMVIIVGSSIFSAGISNNP